MTQQAIIHRMVLPDHVCPYGLKAKQLLERRGFAVDDRPLTTRADVDAFKAAHGLKTTPLIVIDGVRIGGYDDLRRHLGLEPDNSVVPLHSPAVALLAATALAALSMTQTWF